MRLDRWLDGWARPADDRIGATDEDAAALAAVALRYLHAYGPATAADFAQWLAMPPEAASAVFATLDLVAVEAAGRQAWLPTGADAVPPLGGTVRLLPHFDAYLIGCQPRAMVFPGAAAGRALRRGAAGQVPVLLVDGVTAGVWQHRRSGRRVALTVEPFVRLDRQQRQELHEQAHRIGEILQAEAAVEIGEVTARPHL